MAKELKFSANSPKRRVHTFSGSVEDFNKDFGETIDDQIDRLNNAIKDMMGGIESNKKVMSVDFLSNTVNSEEMSLEGTSINKCFEDNYSETSSNFQEEVYIEDLLLQLERAQMTAEDYSSREFNKRPAQVSFGNFAADLGSSLGLALPTDSTSRIASAIKSHFQSPVELSLEDLYRLGQEVSKIINFAEQDISYEGVLSFPGKSIPLKVMPGHISLPDKNTLGKIQPLSTTEPYSQKDALIQQLLNEVQDLQSRATIPDSIREFDSQLKQTMEAAFQKINKDFEEGPIYSPASKELQNKKLKAIQKTNQHLQQKLDWEITESQIAKNKYQKLVSELNHKKEFFEKQALLIKTKNIQLVKEKAKLEEDWENLTLEKKKFKNYELETQAKLNNQRQKLNSMQEQFEQLKKTNSSKPQNLTDERIIQQKIKTLEDKIKLQGNSEQLQIELIRLKTQLTKVRSKNAIIESERRPSRLKSLMSTIEKQWEHRDSKSCLKVRQSIYEDSNSTSSKNSDKNCSIVDLFSPTKPQPRHVKRSSTEGLLI